MVWLDPDHRLTTSNLSQWLEAGRKEGVVVWQQGEATATTALTHPRMFEFFPGVKYEEYAFQHMASASVVVLVYTQATHTKLMLPWLRCALTESCINPIGAQDSGCRSQYFSLFLFTDRYSSGSTRSLSTGTVVATDMMCQL